MCTLSLSWPCKSIKRDDYKPEIYNNNFSMVQISFLAKYLNLCKPVFTIFLQCITWFYNSNHLLILSLRSVQVGLTSLGAGVLHDQFTHIVFVNL